MLKGGGGGEIGAKIAAFAADHYATCPVRQAALEQGLPDEVADRKAKAIREKTVCGVDDCPYTNKDASTVTRHRKDCHPPCKYGCGHRHRMF